MKILATSYTFDASLQTIDCSLFTSLESVLLITNVTDNEIIYNFSDPTLGGTLAGTVLTLTYDTTSMSDTDNLQIFVDDGTSAADVNLHAGDGTPITQTSGQVDVNIAGDGTGALQTIADNSDSIVASYFEQDSNQQATDKGIPLLVRRSDTLAALTDTDGDYTVPQVNADGAVYSEVVSSVLPAGAATAANQSTANGLLTTIDADTGNLPTIETNTDFGTVTGGGTETGALRVTIANNSTGVVSIDDNGSTVSIDDGAGSITIDGTVAVSGTVAVTDNSGSLTVDAPVTTPAFVRLSDGSAAISTLPVSLASVPSHAVTNAGTFAVQAAQSGTWTVQPGNTANTTPWLTSQTPVTSGGLSTYHLVSAASTNATSVKASAGQLYGYYIYNSNASARKVAFHNTSGTPTAGASVFFSLVIPPSSGANVAFPSGIAFSTGIGITTVTDLTDSGTTAVGASDLIINLFYK